jgi:hypothetical protein
MSKFFKRLGLDKEDKEDNEEQPDRLNRNLLLLVAALAGVTLLAIYFSRESATEIDYLHFQNDLLAKGSEAASELDYEHILCLLLLLLLLLLLFGCCFLFFFFY